MVYGIAGRYKRYVEVEHEVAPDGMPRPVRVLWPEGPGYFVEEVLDVRAAPARRVTGEGVRYTVRVRGCLTYLFLEGDRWFCEAKEAEL